MANKPSRLHLLKARIAIYMADGRLPWPVYKTLLKFGCMFEAASRGGTWLEADALDALYQAAMARARCGNVRFRPYLRKHALKLLVKSKVAEWEEPRARWAESEEGAEEAAALAEVLRLEEIKQRQKDKDRKKAVSAKDSLGKKMGA